MSYDQQPTRRLTRDELARAVRTEPGYIDELLSREVLFSDQDGLFRPSDIQRVRAVIAMQSPGVGLDQLVEVFRRQFYTMQPMDLLYPDPPVVIDTTPAELAASLGISEAELTRTMSAAGFTTARAGVPMRADDVSLATMLVHLGLSTGGVQATLRAARVFGDAARRSAETAVAIFDEGVTSQVDAPEAFEETRYEVNRLGAELMAESEKLLAELYRRHLEHALLRLWATAAENFLDGVGVRPAVAVTPGIAFVDLTGYTRQSAMSGDSIAVQLSGRLFDLAETAASNRDGRVVKLLGDGAMLHFEEPLDAVRGALEMLASIAGSGLPAGHAGVHSGPVIARDGDYFGRTVNLAARISSAAVAGQVLVSADVARIPAVDLSFTPAGEREAKGIGQIEVFEAAWRD